MIYRLSQQDKVAISANLVDFMESDVPLSKKACSFIGNWILSGPDEKTKAFYDVWDIVLRSYMPQRRPILYRSCSRLTDNKIVSFTGRLGAAQRFSQGRGLLLICDTDELLPVQLAGSQQRGRFRNTFFSVADLLKKEAQSPSCQFSERLIRDYIGEDEYILRVNLGLMCAFKWHTKDPA